MRSEWRSLPPGDGTSCGEEQDITDPEAAVLVAGRRRNANVHSVGSGPTACRITLPSPQRGSRLSRWQGGDFGLTMSGGSSEVRLRPPSFHFVHQVCLVVKRSTIDQVGSIALQVPEIMVGSEHAPVPMTNEGIAT